MNMVVKLFEEVVIIVRGIIILRLGFIENLIIFLLVGCLFISICFERNVVLLFLIYIVGGLVVKVIVVFVVWG